MDDSAKSLIAYSDHLFSNKGSLLSHWQDIAENFYFERADFTASHNTGYDYSTNMVTGIPSVARRDLANVISSMMRPQQQWFFMSTARDDRVDLAGKQWLEWATGLQWRAMYDPVAMLSKACTQCDNDYTSFGQGVVSVEIDWKNQNLLYRCWHLRDVAWCENASGQIDTIFRKWKPTIRELVQLFGKNKLDSTMAARLEKEPYARVEILHCIVPSAEYKGKKKIKQPYVSVYIDRENNHIIEEVGKWTTMYVIPRWQTVSGSQYAYSPAVIAAFPDARLIQQITLTLLEAGEKMVDPPRVAPAGILRSDMFLQAGGVSMYDPEYDERTGDILRPIMQDVGGMPYATRMHEKAEANIKEAFFLNKVGIAPITKEMTAYEASQHVQENIRNMLPLFGPTEMEYNGALCNITFDELRYANAFGNPNDIPESLRGAEVKFRFESPIHRLVERTKGQQFMEARALLAESAALDPQSPSIFKTRVALRDALEGIGTSVSWLNSDDEMQKINEMQDQAEQAQQIIGAMGQAAAVAKDAGAATESFARARNGGTGA